MSRNEEENKPETKHRRVQMKHVEQSVNMDTKKAGFKMTKAAHNHHFHDRITCGSFLWSLCSVKYQKIQKVKSKLMSSNVLFCVNPDKSPRV